MRPLPSPYQSEFDGTALVLFLQAIPLSDKYHQILLTDEQIRKLYKILPDIIGTPTPEGGFDLELSEKFIIEVPGIKDRYSPQEIENDTAK